MNRILFFSLFLSILACAGAGPKDSGTEDSDTEDSDTEDSAGTTDTADTEDTTDSADTAPTPDEDGDGFTLAEGDCDDTDATSNPAEVEVPYDGADNDCNPATPDDDLDGDGYTLAEGDCDDTYWYIYPGATEVYDCKDDDCDGEVDEGTTANIFYRDSDGDGFGDVSSTVEGCEAPEGYVSNHTDCDDDNWEVYPGAMEVVDGLDNDCDGEVDEP